MLKPFRPGETVLSKTRCDKDDKTFQFWPDAFRWQGEGQAHRQHKLSLNSDTESWPKADDTLFLISDLLIQPIKMVRDPSTIKMKTGSFMTWVGKLKLICS